MEIDPNEIRIRSMTEADMPSVLEINRACFTRPFAEAYCRSFIDAPNKPAVVAEYSGTVMGFMLVDVLAEHVYLNCLAVHPYYQDLRVGTKLVRWLQNQLPELGRDTLELHMYSLDIAPLRLYTSTDFKLVAEIPGMYADGTTGYLMRWCID